MRRCWYEGLLDIDRAVSVKSAKVSRLTELLCTNSGSIKVVDFPRSSADFLAGSISVSEWRITI